MNFDTFTPAQRASVQYVDGPLFIAAGAGSGKTFTLQQRIAYALLPESGPACASIDEVLAITFMEKAAAEVKARVRAALRAEGMAAEALKVDSAWISTIHGMCSRILRENALEAGVDPAFSVLSEFDERILRAEALEAVLRREQSAGGAYAALFAEYGVRAGGSSFGDSSVQGMLRTLLEKAASFTEGLAGIDAGPEPPAASAIARDVLAAYDEALALVEGVMGNKPGKRQEETRLACAQAAEALEALLLEGDVSYERLVDVLVECTPLRRDGFGKQAGEAGQETCAKVQSALLRARKNVAAALARPHREALLKLAAEVEEEYQGRLLARGALDNNGLLHRTRALLLNRPDVAARYQRRFKLVMVDEFQDTNQLQVDLITLVAGADSLCTVGDAQQSIYRFNGADVNVFERQRARVAADDTGRALMQQLDDNFRSHGDVLAFVRRVCGQDRVFGDGFLDLRASRKEKGAYRGAGPRIEVHLASYEGSKEASGAVRAEAAAIAERFAALREAGHTAGDMVVLLSRMTNAEAYADALRERGFACVLGGGRSFYSREEVRTVGSVLAALADPADTEALFSALTSDMVQLSADDFLCLATVCDENTGDVRRRGIDRGLVELMRCVGACEGEGSAAQAGAGGGAAAPESAALSDAALPGSAEEAEGSGARSGADSAASPAAHGALPAASPALRFALRLFARARARIGAQRRPSEVLRALLSESGWLARLEAQGVEGLAAAANVLKAVRVVEEIEAAPAYGLARVARDFRLRAETVSEAPGSLSVADQNAVRIMTIHKSKGLEFPIVAAAAYDPYRGKGGAFSCDAIEGRVRLALSLSRGEDKRWKRLSCGEVSAALAVDDAADPAQFAVTLSECGWDEEVAEARRKFYVACTRASEYLLVCGLVKEAKDPLDGYKATPIFDDVRAALVGDSDFPEAEMMIDYGGSEPLRFTRERVSPGEAGAAGGEAASAEGLEGEGAEARGAWESSSEGDAGAASATLGRAASWEVPVLGSLVFAPCEPVPWTAREGMFSYSSIAPHDVHVPVELRDDVSDGLARLREGDALEEAADDETCGAAVPSATDLGSAFHRIAQLAVERRSATGALLPPPAARVDAIARRYGVEAGKCRARLDAALDRWFASDIAARATAFATVRAEVPFLVEMPFEGSLHLMEGEIDLLATDAERRRAFVVDYKTGGSDEEMPERLHEKHLLQATCYAYAVLAQGYDEVEFAFVRVERDDAAAPGQPQAVPYVFTRDDVPALEEAIERAAQAAV